jgi:mRNA interferase MazF
MGPILMMQGDILLVPFPFSDLSGTKVRPVVVTSNDKFNKSSSDVIVSCITSKHSARFEKITSESLRVGTLHKTCYVKHESLIKLDKKIFIKKIGSLKTPLIKNIRKRILDVF